MIHIDVKVIPDWLGVMSSLDSSIRRRVESAVWMESERLMTESKLVTPVETGALRASGIVEPPEWRGDTVTVRLGFGGPAASYAYIVHEDLMAHHPVGHAKYLEGTVRENVASGQSLSRIRADLNRAAS